MEKCTTEKISVMVCRKALDITTPYVLSVSVPLSKGKDAYMDDLMNYMNTHRFINIGGIVFNTYEIVYISWSGKK